MARKQIYDWNTVDPILYSYTPKQLSQQYNIPLKNIYSRRDWFFARNCKIVDAEITPSVFGRYSFKEIENRNIKLKQKMLGMDSTQFTAWLNGRAGRGWVRWMIVS